MIDLGAESLEKFRRDLGDVLDRLPDEIDAAERDIADANAQRARTYAYRLGSTAAHVAPSIRAHDGTVALGGGSEWAMAPGAEFGRDNLPQFKPYRGGGEDAGYFLYPAIDDNEDDTIERYGDAVDRALREAF